MKVMGGAPFWRSGIRVVFIDRACARREGPWAWAWVVFEAWVMGQQRRLKVMWVRVTCEPLGPAHRRAFRRVFIGKVE